MHTLRKFPIINLTWLVLLGLTLLGARLGETGLPALALLSLAGFKACLIGCVFMELIHAPRWMLVDFEFVAKLPTYVPLQQMKEDAALEGMAVLQKGTRLSITPVDAKHFKRLCKLGGWKEGS